MELVDRFTTEKIKYAQIDPFGWCNAKCWFCPVKYQPLPLEGRTMMPVDLLEKIFDNLSYERELDQIVSKNLNHFYTAHYNEVLLYKHLGSMFELARKYKFQTMVLSNGTTLTPEKTDLIAEYPDVVKAICLNIPAFDSDTWSERAGFPKEKFDQLVDNVQFAKTKLNKLVDNKSFMIQVNGLDNDSFKYGIVKGPDFDQLGINVNTELGDQTLKAQTLFPGVHVIKQNNLVDRSGLISHIIVHKKHNKSKVVGCNNMGDRSLNWLHVNASGKAFLCCNDYNYDYQFGDFVVENLRDFWGSTRHIETIERSYSDFCVNCASAKFEH